MGKVRGWIWRYLGVAASIKCLATIFIDLLWAGSTKKAWTRNFIDTRGWWLILATFWCSCYLLVESHSILYYILLSAYIAGGQLDCHFIGASVYSSICIVDLNLTIL